MQKRKVNNDELFITTTDTVIGIGGKVNPIVHDKIYKIKQRDISKKLVIVVGSIRQLKKIEKLSKKHLDYIKKFWPGDTTLIINGNGYRIPNNKKLIKFIKKEGPFYLTSANISNHSTIKNEEEAREVFPGIKFFDFGNGSGVPSKVIDIDSDKRLR